MPTKSIAKQSPVSPSRDVSWWDVARELTARSLWAFWGVSANEEKAVLRIRPLVRAESLCMADLGQVAGLLASIARGEQWPRECDQSDDTPAPGFKLIPSSDKLLTKGQAKGAAWIAYRACLLAILDMRLTSRTDRYRRMTLLTAHSCVLPQNKRAVAVRVVSRDVWALVNGRGEQ
jgi:hypothetical protein